MIDIFTNEGFVALLGIYAIAAVGMNLSYVTGQLNLGQAGFFAVGAYSVAVVNKELSWSLLPSLCLAAALAAAVAFPIAFGATRLRGLYLIMGTLAIGEVIRVVIGNVDSIGGVQGYSGLEPIGTADIYVALASVTALTVALMASPLGLQMRSLFDDEDAAAAAGVATRRTRIASLVLSAAIVAVAGGLFARYQLFIAPRDFGIALSFNIALFAVIGGTHSVLGALVGAASINGLLEFLKRIEDVGFVPEQLSFLSSWRLVVFGLLVIVVMIWRPEGLVTRTSALRLTAPFRRLPERFRRATVEGSRGDRGPGGEPVLRLDQVGHRFGGVAALDGVSLSVGPAEIVALIGANGAGKSTLVDVVCGRHALQAGRIWLNGGDIGRLRADARTKLGLARTFQAVRTFGHLTVEEHVRLGRRAAGARPAPVLGTVLELIGLAGERDRLPESLSLAAQRRLEIGRTLASAPEVLLLDEPSAGLNDAERAELAELIEAIRRAGTAVVLIDHNLDLALGVADRAIVLDFGALLVSGSPDEIVSSPAVRAAYLGEEEPVLA